MAWAPGDLVLDEYQLFDTLCNLDMVDLESIWQPEDLNALRDLVTRHHRWLAVLYTRQGRTEDAAREKATVVRLAREAESQAFQGVKESMSELLQQSSAADAESAGQEP